MNKKLYIKSLIALSALGIITFMFSCKSVKVPSDLKVVDNFEVKKYAGLWYEIARFDFKHEKDMDNVTANYSLNDDGSIKVVNKGYNFKDKEWKETEGKAKFVESENKGALKVSFFGPFYAGYNVVKLDKDYKYALIFGESKDYIWILSREKTIPTNIKNEYIEFAKNYGYDLSRLVWTKQE